MRRLTRLAVLGLILSPFGPVEAAQDAWKPVKAGGMSVSLPCTADWETNKMEIPEEASVVTTSILACKTSDSLYLIQWSEVVTNAPFDGMEFLRSSRDAMVKEAGGSLLKAAEIEHDGLKGIEFTANLRGTSLLTSRGVFHGKRMYQVSIGTPLNQDRSKDINRLLTSLKVAR